jgi:hypothetical protein
MLSFFNLLLFYKKIAYVLEYLKLIDRSFFLETNGFGLLGFIILQ